MNALLIAPLDPFIQRESWISKERPTITTKCTIPNNSKRTRRGSCNHVMAVVTMSWNGQWTSDRVCTPRFPAWNLLECYRTLVTAYSRQVPWYRERKINRIKRGIERQRSNKILGRRRANNNVSWSTLAWTSIPQKCNMLFQKVAECLQKLLGKARPSRRRRYPSPYYSHAAAASDASYLQQANELELGKLGRRRHRLFARNRRQIVTSPSITSGALEHVSNEPMSLQIRTVQ